MRRAPAWIAILDAAKEWGTPPWKIAGGTRVSWYVRYAARRDIEIKEQQRAKEK